jgi:hypothetical protein
MKKFKKNFTAKKLKLREDGAVMDRAVWQSKTLFKTEKMRMRRRQQ